MWEETSPAGHGNSSRWRSLHFLERKKSILCVLNYFFGNNFSSKSRLPRYPALSASHRFPSVENEWEAVFHRAALRACVHGAFRGGKLKVELNSY
jgi:hypothetical protein